MASLRDGLGFDKVMNSGLALGNSAYFTGSVFAGTGFVGTGGALAATNGLGTGSPTAYGNQMQFGVVSGTNVAVVVTFGTPFKSAPVVVTQLLISGAQATNAGYVAGPTALGSFVFLGVSGAPYSWIAIGSM
jgi:hypothetical protein